MTENQWKKPKEIDGELQWKHGLIWRDIYFQVTGDTIYLYSKSRRGDNRILHSICLTQVDEISEIGTKFSKRCFKIILKMGAIEQFKCPAKMESVKVQQLIANLRHAQTFWTDKENLQQRKLGSDPRRITLERPDAASKGLDVTKHRVFFTLWNGEMIGLLVNATSTFTSVYSRLFSFACESKSCSVCKIRHQSCDLWAVDTTGTARRVRKDELLTDLDKEGNCLFVMEHHQKLLVVFFSDFSYETIPVPSGITAKQVLKHYQIALKLNELCCFDPGLFLRREDGTEVQFCMNDNPFSYQEYGKFVARSKMIRLNSLKKSDYEVIADIRRKEFEHHVRRKKTSDAVNEILANRIRKSTRMDEELCFVDDHFELDNGEAHSVGFKRTTTEPRGTQALPIHGTDDGECNISDIGGRDDGDDVKTRGDKLSVFTCSEMPDCDLISPTTDVEDLTKSPDDNCSKNSGDVINTTSEVAPVDTTSPDSTPNHATDPDPIHKTNSDSSYTTFANHSANVDHEAGPGSIPDPTYHKPSQPKTDPTDHKPNSDHISDNKTNSNPILNHKASPVPNHTTNQSASFEERGKNLIHSQSDGLVFQKQRHEDIASSHPPINRTGMRRSLSDLNVRYSFTSSKTRDSVAKTRDSRAMSEPDLLEKNDVLRVDEVFQPNESSGGSDDEEIYRPSELSTFTGPTWTFAKRVEECVRKILNVKNDITQVEKLIREDLCRVLFELLDHGLKKKFWAVSLLSIGSNVWDICQTVSKATNVGVNVTERIKGGSIDQKFHIFIRECIRHKILTRWFEELSSENVQKQIMKYYEPSAVVLEPEHSKAMEHLKLYLDGLDVLKLKVFKARRESTEHRSFLISFE